MRQRLLAAATELVPERGWTAVSTRVLADRAGVTPSAVHYHYPTMQSLLREAVVEAMREVLGGLGPSLAQVRDPGEMVDALFSTLEPYTGADPLSLLFVEAYLAARRDPELAERIGGLLVEFRGELAGWLRERGVAEPDATAEVLAACVDGLMLHRGLAPGGEPAEIAAVLRKLVVPAKKGARR
jgi:AcrR family transcriptional regulator